MATSHKIFLLRKGRVWRSSPEARSRSKALYQTPTALRAIYAQCLAHWWNLINVSERTVNVRDPSSPPNLWGEWPRLKSCCANLLYMPSSDGGASDLIMVWANIICKCRNDQTYLPNRSERAETIMENCDEEHFLPPALKFPLKILIAMYFNFSISEIEK